MQKTVNNILEIRVKGTRRRKQLHKLVNSYLHSRNVLYILINKNLDFFLNLGLNLWNLNLLFTDKLYNRGDSEKKLRVKNRYQQELLTEDENQDLVLTLKEFKNSVGNAIFQSMLKEVLDNYKSYFNSLRSYKKNPEKFKSKPRPPRARKLKTVNNCSIQFTQLNSQVCDSLLNLQLRSKSSVQIKLPKWFDHKVSSVRLVKKLDDLYIQLVYEEQIQSNLVDANFVAGIDLGLDNLVTVVTNNPQLNSFIVSGKELKSFNQWYNKLLAKLQSNEQSIQRRKLERYRQRRLKSMLHQITSKLSLLFLRYGIKEVIVGKSAVESKNGINLRKKNNQNFVCLPLRTLLSQLKYKCERFGIRVVETEESYTSKCSALSDIKVKKQEYSGKRIKRGLYKDTKINKAFNADCNGALNIIKKIHKEVVSNLPTKVWIDKLSRPIRLTYNVLVKTLQHVIQKVSREFPKGITGSTGEHKVVPSYPEVSMGVL